MGRPDSRFLILSTLAVGLAGTLRVSAEPAAQLPDTTSLEAQNAFIGEIIFEPENVFDLSDPKEDNWVFRLANRIHIVTREGTIRKQLLLASGDRYSKRLADETERILRQNKYIHDADIQPEKFENGVVDLKVTTRDLWSLAPEISFARGGGENRTQFGLEESNLLGRGQLLSFLHADDVDRKSTRIGFADHHIGRSWVSTTLRYSDNSDGNSHLSFCRATFLRAGCSLVRRRLDIRR